MDHLDETGAPCTRHPGIASQRLFELATLGSRVTGFHHDAASKLQALLMTMEEAGELAAQSSAELGMLLESALMALRELNALFAANRALAKPPTRSRVKVRDLLEQARTRVGVQLRGNVPDAEVHCTVSAITHAIAMVLDIAGGRAYGGRVVDVSVAVDGERYAFTLVGPPDAGAKPPLNANELLSLAAFVITRDEGELRCGGGSGEKFVVWLPKPAGG